MRSKRPGATRCDASHAIFAAYPAPEARVIKDPDRAGKRHVVVMRKACHQRLRRAVYHWARVELEACRKRTASHLLGKGLR